MRRGGLGKGLSQLVSEQYEGAPTELSVDAIRPNALQPRTTFDEASLAELADSVREFGVLSPLLVRPVSADVYELIAGERRWRAARAAGLANVPVIVRNATNREALEIAIVENLQREDVPPLESARAYRRLIEEFGLTQEAVAGRVNKARTTVSNHLRLLKLPPDALAALEGGAITEGHARALLAFKTPEAITRVLKRVVDEGLSVRQVERLSQEKTPPPAKRKADPDVARFQESLGERIGARVRVVSGKRGGKIEIRYANAEELARLGDLLLSTPKP